MATLKYGICDKLRSHCAPAYRVSHIYVRHAGVCNRPQHDEIAGCMVALNRVHAADVVNAHIAAIFKVKHARVKFSDRASPFEHEVVNMDIASAAFEEQGHRRAAV